MFQACRPHGLEASPLHKQGEDRGRVWLWQGGWRVPGGVQWDFTVVTDHKPIVPMYNSHSKSMPVRVAKHKSKLRAFDFEVIYEAGLG